MQFPLVVKKQGFPVWNRTQVSTQQSSSLLTRPEAGQGYASDLYFWVTRGELSTHLRFHSRFVCLALLFFLNSSVCALVERMPPTSIDALPVVASFVSFRNYSILYLFREWTEFVVELSIIRLGCQ